MTAEPRARVVDRQGIITFQRGYGVEDAASWERVFEELLQR